MVASESDVRPSVRGIPLNEDSTVDELLKALAGADSLSPSRSSRPHHDDGWQDDDYYFAGGTADVPSTSWKEMYTKMDNISVNGAIKRHWQKLGIKEVEQIIAQCRIVPHKEEGSGIRREDFSVHSLGVNSPLFNTFRMRLGWDHPISID